MAQNSLSNPGDLTPQRTGQSEAETEVFGTFPPGARIFFGGAAVVLLLLALVCLWLTLLPVPGKENTIALKLYLAFGGVILLFGAYLSWLYAGPNYIAFDYARRVYVAERGFPFKARRQTGAFSEIQGLFLRATQGRNFQNYHLVIAWRDERRPEQRLQIYANLDAAQEEARRLAAQLGVPCETEPKTGEGVSTI